MKIAQNLKIVNTEISIIRNYSISEWQDETGNCFAYSFDDGSSLIVTGCGWIACSTEALQRWCSEGKIDTLLTRFA